MVDGKRYKLRFADISHTKNKGDVDPPCAVGKEIRLDRTLTGEELLEIVIHEIRHIQDWKRDEDYITQEARDIAAIIWKLGFRQRE